MIRRDSIKLGSYRLYNSARINEEKKQPCARIEFTTDKPRVKHCTTETLGPLSDNETAVCRIIIVTATFQAAACQFGL